MQSLKKIAFFSHTAKLSGAPKSLYLLMKGMKEKGHDVHLFCNEEGDLTKNARLIGIACELVNLIGTANFFTRKRFKKVLCLQAFDCAYLNCAHKYTRAAASICYKLKLPIVWHIREPPKGSRVQRSLPLMKKFRAKVVVVSQEQKAVVENVLPCTQVDNGVDLSEFGIDRDSGMPLRKRFGLEESELVFGIVGTVENRKRTKEFIEAAKVLLNKYDSKAGGKALKFLIVGDTSREYAANLQKMVSNDPLLKDKIIFSGPLTAMPHVYNALDVLTMISSWEGFPRVVIEAMASATPIIATDTGEVSAMLNQGEFGQVVQVDDHKALVYAMIRAIDCYEELQQTAVKAKDYAATAFSVAKYVDTLEKILIEAAASDKA